MVIAYNERLMTYANLKEVLKKDAIFSRKHLLGRIQEASKIYSGKSELRSSRTSLLSHELRYKNQLITLFDSKTYATAILIRPPSAS